MPFNQRQGQDKGVGIDRTVGEVEQPAKGDRLRGSDIFKERLAFIRAALRAKLNGLVGVDNPLVAVGVFVGAVMVP